MVTSQIELCIELVCPNIERTQSSQLRAPHKEVHSDHGEVVRDIIIGVAVGLIVPFTLTAVLSA